LPLNLGITVLAKGEIALRIKPEATKCVVFFGKELPDGNVEYRGTGFLITYNDGDLACPYLVTCRHVARHLEGPFTIRLNLKDGAGSHPEKIGQAGWSYHPDNNVDLAAVPFAAGIHHYDHLYFDIAQCAVRENVWPGDPINIVGLFRLHQGLKRMMPVVHSGNIALLADPNETVLLANRATGETIHTETYLIEAQTLEGLSGSPVFVREIAPLQGAQTASGHQAGVLGDLFLLGIYAGAWDGRPGEVLADDRGLKGQQRIPVGMGMVVPADKLIELIVDDPNLSHFRKNWRAGRDKATKQQA
jgi:hypothetical protein